MRGLFVVLVSGACVTRLAAQTTPDTLRPGDFLRLRHIAPCCSSPLRGRLQALNADSLVLDRDGRRLAVQLAAIQFVERGEVRGSRVLPYAAAGLVIGAASGVVLGLGMGSIRCEGFTPTGCRAIGAVMMGGIDAIAGLIGGGMMGARNPPIEWHPYSLPPPQ